ncbi:E3 ubiquitin-protein ligase RNF10-like protein [Drosera capensis]
MSILPTQANQASSSSSQSHLQNPNFNHGLFSHHQQHNRHQRASAADRGAFVAGEAPSLDSLGISNGEGSSAIGTRVSGWGSRGPVDSGGSSSKKVNAYVKANGSKISPRQISGRRAQQQAGAQREVGPIHLSKEVAGVEGSPPNGLISGSARKRAQSVNGNHLLNFHYTPISRPQQSAPPVRKPRKSRPYNKDLFLQANYKFVVLDSGDYHVEEMDPDKMLQWEDIICVKYSPSHDVQCPICLESPMCPQITSCGHIFCYPCILQYLLMGEENGKGECWRKCPLCFMMISSKEMYTILIESVKQYQVGDVVDFTLLTRKKDSFALHQKLEGMTATKPMDSFSKFILTSDVDLSVREPISELDNWLARADSGLVDDMEKLPYICAAMEHLEQRKKHWDEYWSHNGDKANEDLDSKAVFHIDSGSEPRESESRSLPNGVDVQSMSGHVISTAVKEIACMLQVSDTDESLDGSSQSLSSSHDKNKILEFQSMGHRDSQDSNAYNFYQAVDGQHIILHPLNIKCLLHHYGNHDLLPPRVSGKILELETVTQSEAMRKRYRSLSHFPLTTTFQLCEIDLGDSLPLDSLSPFTDEIRKREKNRKQLAKKEHREKVKAEAISTADLLSIPYDSRQFSYYEEPAFSMDDFEALGSSTVASSSPPIHDSRTLFSNVIRLGFAAAHDSPSLRSEEPQPEQQNQESSTNQVARSFANVTSTKKPAEMISTPSMKETGKKGKKQGRVLLSTTSGRRY